MIYDLKETHKLEIQKQIINMYIKIIKYYLQNQMIFVISIQIMMIEGLREVIIIKHILYVHKWTTMLLFWTLKRCKSNLQNGFQSTYRMLHHLKEMICQIFHLYEFKHKIFTSFFLELSTQKCYLEFFAIV